MVVAASPTRYGRVSYTLVADGASPYRVKANVSLPTGYVGAAGPPGGLRLRLRAPQAHVGKLSSVTVGSKPWTAFDPKLETIDFAAGSITLSLQTEMQAIVAVWR